jgi:hypothetical protein
MLHVFGYNNVHKCNIIVLVKLQYSLFVTYFIAVSFIETLVSAP